MACLQFCRELLSLTTKYVSNLKTTGHIKLIFFLQAKLQENLLLAKSLISVTAPLTFIYIILRGSFSKD